MRTTASTTLDYIPEPIRAFVARRGAEVVGLGLTGAAAGTTLALASWSVDDPSFNHAASGPVHKLLGAPGRLPPISSCNCSGCLPSSSLRRQSYGAGDCLPPGASNV
jgi:hypothetical protein